MSEFCARFVLQILLLNLGCRLVLSAAPVQSIIIAEVPSMANAIRPTAYQRCITPNKGLGQCMHLLRCQLPEFNSDRLRFMDYFCIIERVYVGVCCPDAFIYQMNPGQSFYGNPAGILPAIGNDLTEVHIIEIDPNAPPQARPPPQGNVPQTNATQAGQQQEEDSTKKIMFEERRGCGVNQNEYYSRVVGGRPADPKQWPWMVSLIRNREHFCGGVLITDRHVLTAAHCLKGINMKTVMVRLGEHDLRRIDETRTQDFRVSDMMIHKDFDVNTYENDIAILKMDRAARFNSYAWPVCLPQPNAEFVDEDAIVIEHRALHAALRANVPEPRFFTHTREAWWCLDDPKVVYTYRRCWGAIEYGGPTSDILMEVSVPVWNNTKCDNEYLQPILDTNLCAGGQTGRDSCQGDSGGPLLYQLPNKRWITIGVVSWGIRCGEERPAVYTKVSKYLDWILKNSAF